MGLVAELRVQRPSRFVAPRWREVHPDGHDPDSKSAFRAM